MGRAYLPEAWIRDAGVSPQTRCLAGVLSSYADAEHGDQDVWPSPETLAKMLGISKRHITRLGDEGQAAGWWTRIYERNFRGGVELTWRLHFPAFSPNGHRSDTEATSVSAGRNDSGNADGAERTANGHRTDTEATPMSAGRYEGKKVGRDEDSLTLAAPEPKQVKPKPRAKKPLVRDNPPTREEVEQAFIERGMPRAVARIKTIAFFAHYEREEVNWTTMRNKVAVPLTSWRGAVQTFYARWVAENPAEAGARAKPAYTVQPGQRSDPYR